MSHSKIKKIAFLILKKKEIALSGYRKERFVYQNEKNRRLHEVPIISDRSAISLRKVLAIDRDFTKLIELVKEEFLLSILMRIE